MSTGFAAKCSSTCKAPAEGGGAPGSVLSGGNGLATEGGTPAAKPCLGNGPCPAAMLGNVGTTSIEGTDQRTRKARWLLGMWSTVS